jgi:hypothetical protein
VDRGFPESQALAALTTVPAKKMGKSDQLGKIKIGFLANLTIVDGNYFHHKSQIISTWVGGEEYPVKPKYDISVDGEWHLTIGKNLYQLEFQKKMGHYSGKIIQDTIKYNLSKLKIEGRFISWQVKLDSTLAPSRFTGHILENRIEGTAHDLQVSWSAMKTGALDKKEEKKEPDYRSELSVFYPEGTYGLEYPKGESQIVLIRNTTVWTCGSQGTLEGIDILFHNGKVKEIGKNINKPKEALEIDGSSKHITPGLID